MQNGKFHGPNQILEPSRLDQTKNITRGVIRLLTDTGISPLLEFNLANGRRADIAGFDRSGKLTIVEVKSCRSDFEADNKWPEYLDFCDRFYFAVDSGFPLNLLPDSEGFIIADYFGATVRRSPKARMMAAARRKAITLRFARQAARRLTSNSDNKNGSLSSQA